MKTMAKTAGSLSAGLLRPPSAPNMGQVETIHPLSVVNMSEG